MNTRNHIFDEVDQMVGMLPVLKEKVNSIVFFFDVDTFIMSVVLKNDLLKEKKCFFVCDRLSQLDNGSPGVGSEFFLTIFALLPVLSELYYKAFLNFNIFYYFFLNCQLDFNSSRMWLGIDETCIDDFYCVKTPNFFEAECQEVFGLTFAVSPWRSEVSSTISTLI